MENVDFKEERETIEKKLKMLERIQSAIDSNGQSKIG